MDDVFRALADPHRRELLDRLNARNGQTLRELCAGLEMTRQSVSKHLAILEQANLVSTRTRGREKFHYLNPVPINAIAERWMTRFDRQRAGALADLKTALEQPIMDNTFVYVTYIRTTPEQLWTALTDGAFTSQYWGVTFETDWQAGSPMAWKLGEVVMDRDDQRVLEADPPRRLSFTWHALTEDFLASYGDTPEWNAKAAAEPLSKVTFEIEPAGSVVKLTVTHDGFEPGSVILEAVSGGWLPLLSSLKSLLETGEALEISE
jgi:uncharacterized protein YndB with AHSA1/START domain/DNA-binding transcriptional ArsR family regulator